MSTAKQNEESNSDVSDEGDATDVEGDMAALKSDLNVRKIKLRGVYRKFAKTHQEHLDAKTENNTEDTTKALKKLKKLRAVIEIANNDIKLLQEIGKSLTSQIPEGSSIPTSKSLQPTSRLPTDCAEWKTGKTDVESFLAQLEAKLLAHDTAEDHWYRIFGKVTSNDDLLWVRTNILDKKPKWPEARKAFFTQYSGSDYAFTCRNKLLDLKQGNQTGVQFLRKVENLAAAGQQSLEDPFFIQALVKALNREYYDLLTTRKKPAELSYASLNVELTYLDTILKDKKGSPNEPTVESKSTTKIQCDFCGGQHKTKACRKKKTHDQNSGSNSTAESSNSSKRTTSKDAAAAAAKAKEAKLKNVTCHSCGNKGHYANDPSCPKFGHRNANVAKKLAALKKADNDGYTATAEDLEFDDDYMANAIYHYQQQ